MRKAAAGRCGYFGLIDIGLIDIDLRDIGLRDKWWFRMIEGKSVLAVIPARGGSKGLKDKNIREICGKPLIAYTIEAALGSGVCDKVMVSTDSGRIAEISAEYGAEVPFLRPAELAGDTSKTVDAVIDVIERYRKAGEEFDVLILLQPTSPLRDAGDIRNAAKAFVECGMKGILSVTRTKDHPVFLRRMGPKGELSRYTEERSDVRRQDLEELYRINGAIYINMISDIVPSFSFNDNPYAYEMPPSRSIDIDTVEDLICAEALMRYMDDK